MTSPLITTQKVSAILRASLANYSHVNVTGFYAGHAEIEIRIGGGTPTEKLSDLKQIFAALTAKNIKVYVWHNGDASSDVRLSVYKNQACHPGDASYIKECSDALLDKLMAPVIARHAQYEAEKKAEQARRAHDRQVEMNRRMDQARKQNPKIQVTILEQNLEQTEGVAFSVIKDDHGTSQYLLMQWSYGVHSFSRDEKKTYNVHIHHAPGVGSSSFGGSTSCTDAESLEDAVLTYVATWHV